MKLSVIFIILLLSAGCTAVENFTPEKIKENLQVGVPEKYSVIDAEIPLTYYGTIDGVYIGYQAAPHNVALKAREAFYRYQKTRNTTDLKRALFLTEYLMSNATARDSFVVWEYPFDWPPYNLTKGWTGSLCQAGVLKVHMLAYQGTGDKKYLDFGNKTLLAFDAYVADGGLKIKRQEGNETYYWYPEYAKESPPFVLNGYITALMWLQEYQKATGSELAGKLYDDGMKSLIHYLPDYDMGTWSYYDALGTKATANYHKIHVTQMGQLYNLTGNSMFLEYSKKWSEGLKASEGK